MKEDILRRIEEIVEPILEAHRYVLVDVELRGRPGRFLLQIFVDREAGGITIRELKTLSEEISAHLDVEDPIPGRYTLEVSSPGLDRVLKKDREFRWALGKRVRVTLTSGEVVEGTLVHVDATTLSLSGGGMTREIDRGEVARARLAEIPEIRK